MQFKNLVFEGGGVWGIAYEGALIQLAESGAVDFSALERVAGASAGAITAGLLALGYTPQELGDILRKTDFSDFKDDDLGFARDTARLLEKFGWYKGLAFTRWFRGLAIQKTKVLSETHGIPKPPKQLTFKELTDWQDALRAKGHHLPALYAVGSNLSKQTREIYSAEHTPALMVEKAVRQSMSIPLFFASAGTKDNVIVDGGLTWNYPVNLFDHEDYLSDPAHGLPVSYNSSEGFVFNTETLGFRLDSTKERTWNIKDWANEPIQIDNILKYAWALVTFIRAIANKMHLHKNDWSRTIFIDVGEDIGSTDFDLDDKEKNFLSQAGRKGVSDYLTWYHSDDGENDRTAIYAAMAPDPAD